MLEDFRANVLKIVERIRLPIRGAMPVRRYCHGAVCCVR